MAQLRYGAAIGQALADAMQDDPTVVIMGEDIAGAGGSFGITRGLLDKFGPERVIDTPISEAAIAGMAVGAAFVGLWTLGRVVVGGGDGARPRVRGRGGRPGAGDATLALCCSPASDAPCASAASSVRATASSSR
jgi:hypothetical protein